MDSYGIMKEKTARVLTLLLTTFVLIGGACDDNKSDELKVVPVQEPNSPYDYRYHVVSERNGFKDVPCFAGYGLSDDNSKDFDGKCFTTSLADKSFLLADCFHHSSIAESCRFVKFKSDGTLDASFQSPFSSDHDELMDSPQHEIKSIKDVDVSTDGSIRIEGSFISPLIGWSQEQAGAETGGIGDNAGKEGILVLTKDGKFASFKAVRP